MKHFGVYALVLRGQAVLGAKKIRGPYEGLWDLPGGTPEPGESREETLKRELMEETGGVEISFGLWHEFEVHVLRDSKGGAIDYQHSGAWRLSEMEGVRNDLQPFEDVAELAWLNLDQENLKRMTPPLRRVLAQASRLYPGQVRALN